MPVPGTTPGLMPAQSRQHERVVGHGGLALLVALAVATAGCTAVLPANTPPPDPAPRPPQYVCETAWDVPNGTLTFTIAKGPQVELAPGAAVSVEGDVRGEPPYWMSGDQRPEAVQSGPLGPGDSITVPLEERDVAVGAEDVDVRVVWSVEDGSAATLCSAERGIGGTDQ